MRLTVLLCLRKMITQVHILIERLLIERIWRNPLTTGKGSLWSLPPPPQWNLDIGLCWHFRVFTVGGNVMISVWVCLLHMLHRAPIGWKHRVPKYGITIEMVLGGQPIGSNLRPLLNPTKKQTHVFRGSIFMDLKGRKLLLHRDWRYLKDMFLEVLDEQKQCWINVACEHWKQQGGV